MCHSRKLNNKINAIHERALRITHGDRESSFQQLLEKDNLQVLATEMFKISGNLCRELLNDIFLKRTNPYNLRKNDTFYSQQAHSVYHGTEYLSFLGPKIRESVPLEIKESEILDIFKNKIKQWIPLQCPCRLCLTYLPQIGFL